MGVGEPRQPLGAGQGCRLPPAARPPGTLDPCCPGSNFTIPGRLEQGDGDPGQWPREEGLTEPTASPPVSSGREQLQARKMWNSIWTASPTGLQGICYLLFSGFNLGPSVINQLLIPAGMFN